MGRKLIFSIRPKLPEVFEFARPTLAPARLCTEREEREAAQAQRAQRTQVRVPRPAQGPQVLDWEQAWEDQELALEPEPAELEQVDPAAANSALVMEAEGVPD